MGIKRLFQEDFFLTIQKKYHAVENIQAHPFDIVAIKGSVYINLVPLNTLLLPQQLQSLQVAYQQQGILLVHLWEDVWLNKREQVLSRIHSFCGKNESLHGRKTKVTAIAAAPAKAFLQAHHLQGYIKTKFNFGLMLNQELVAVACFAAARPMKSKGNDYKSAELVRFATKTGYTIVGGLGKLVKHFLQQIKVNDLMTYADRDWSLGKGYDKMGFELSKTMAPILFYFDSKTHHRYLPNKIPPKDIIAFESQNLLTLDEFLKNNGYFKVFNTGNLKYFYYT